VPKPSHFALIVVLILQTFWIGAVHGCQRDLPATSVHSSVSLTEVAAVDQGDSSRDVVVLDACSACHLVPAASSVLTVGAMPTTAHAHFDAPDASHLSPPREGPDRPKWMTAA